MELKEILIEEINERLNNKKVLVMKKKAAAFDIQNYIITILLVIGVLVTFGTLSYDLGQTYEPAGGAVVNESFKATYDHISEIKETTDELQEKIEQADTGDASADTQFFGDVLNSVKIIIPTMGVGLAMVTDFTVALHIPAIWQTIAMTGLVVMIITVIIFMLLKSRGTS